LEDSDDTRNSPSKVLEKHLLDRGAAVVVHDPVVKEFRTDIFETIKGCDAVVIMVAHSAYRKLDLNKIRAALNTAIIVDGRFVLEPDVVKRAGFIYRGIGKAA
jgi:UDP-N-acetyl-D-mannosaminuronate dehydrogenase